MRFADLSDAGRQLGQAIQHELQSPLPRVYCPIAPHGVTVTSAMAVEPVHPLTVERSDDGVRVLAPDAGSIAGACVIVVDDGVETGTVARVAATTLAECNPGYLVLAVPVCSREVSADLRHMYDQIVAVHQPLVRRALHWHYDHLG